MASGGMAEGRKITMPENLLDISTGEFDYSSMQSFFHENGHVWRHILLIDEDAAQTNNPNAGQDKEALALKQNHPDFKVNEQTYNLLLKNRRFRASANLTRELYGLNADERHATGFETIGEEFGRELSKKVEYLKGTPKSRSNKK